MVSRRNILKISAALTAIFPAATPFNALASGAAKPSESNYVNTSQIVAAIMDGMRAVGNMQVDATIYTIDPNLKQRLAASQPLIQSKWRNALQYYISNYYIKGMVPDATLIAALFQKAISAEIGNLRGRVLILAVIAR